MNYCSLCGAKVKLQIPSDDTRKRHVCEACGEIHYLNPRNVVGTIPIWRQQILLCKRAIEPRLGYWTLPAGFLEIGESTTAGAIRETTEEAGARVQIGPLFSLLNVAHVEQVHLFYLAEMQSPVFSAGEESLEVALFDEADIPWQEIAFPTVKQTLQWFLEDRAAGLLEKGKPTHVHSRDIERGERI